MDPFPRRRSSVPFPPDGRSRRHRFAVRLATRVPLLAVMFAVGCAGYQFGNQSLYRTDLATIHVPLFKSETLRLDLGEWLTEAVVKEIEMRTPYKVVNTPLADSVLTGTIRSGDDKHVVSENVNDEPRNLTYQTAVHVTWIDSAGRILMQSIVGLETDFVPEAGQSITTAQQKVIRRTAQQIVSQMEARNW
ncbi:MAG: LPS assembly lipoprotein LptE [Planctomycetota bacterium]